MPRTVADLDAHRLIGYTTNSEMNRWPIKKTGGDATYHVRAHTWSDNMALILSLAREGVGVGRVMDLLAAPLIRRGELVPLLQDEIDSQRLPIHAVMLQERHRLPKIRACVEYWTQWLADLEAASAGAPGPAAARMPRRAKNARAGARQISVSRT
jgi:DNA-binding transcriptional LysR family regulator